MEVRYIISGTVDNHNIFRKYDIVLKSLPSSSLPHQRFMDARQLCNKQCDNPNPVIFIFLIIFLFIYFRVHKSLRRGEVKPLSLLLNYIAVSYYGRSSYGWLTSNQWIEIDKTILTVKITREKMLNGWSDGFIVNGWVDQSKRWGERFH